jgi:hypothetical protein
MAKDSETKFIEIESSEYILNLDFYLHRAILEAIGAIGNAIKKDAPREGLLNLIMSVDIAKGIATSKGLIDLEDIEYQNNLQAYKQKINNGQEIDSRDLIANAQISKYELIIILKRINEAGVKRGKLII